jgi:hypothetical protein
MAASCLRFLDSRRIRCIPWPTRPTIEYAIVNYIVLTVAICVELVSTWVAARVETIVGDLEGAIKARFPEN